jgi:6-hydroxytryprostatin B O-methyltransferase
LRLLFLKRIFYSPTPDLVAHTPTSLILYTNPELAAFIHHCTHEAFPAASRLSDALRLYPDSEKPHQTAFNVAFGTDDPMFTWLEKRPDRFENFNQGMKGVSQGGGRNSNQVVGGYSWAELGKATVVDVSIAKPKASSAYAHDTKYTDALEL